MTEKLIDNSFFVKNTQLFSWLSIDYAMMLSELPAWDKPDTWHKMSSVGRSYATGLSERAQFLCGFMPALYRLGSQPGELRLHVEPLHDLSPEELTQSLQKIATRFNIPVEKIGEGGLTFISRPLLEALHPGADFFGRVTAPFDADQQIFLYDPLTGFILLDNPDRMNNCWLGGSVEFVNWIKNRNAPREKLIFQNQCDLLNVGVPVWERVLQPREQPLYTRDVAGIPTVTVQSQVELDKLISLIENACAIAPFKVTPVYRGQTSERLLPDRKFLVEAGITPYSNIRDHSLLPSIYRNFEQHYVKPESYSNFIGDLVRWHFYERVVFEKETRYVPPLKGTAKSEVSFLAPDSRDPRCLENEMRTVTEHYDAQGNFLGTVEKGHRLVHEDSRRNLILQHYGAPTPVVDVTSDHRVAEFFAFTKLQIGDDGGMTCEAVTDLRTSVLYVLFVPEGMAPLYRSENLLPQEEALRPSRQACLTLGGSGALYRNYASRFIGLKIKFDGGFVPGDLPSPSHLFPSQVEDPMLEKLLIAEKVFGKKDGSRPVYWLQA
ncbi:FRG domain-containing protein [Janthinobacterium sp. SUN137]|uniref:FRG domain-containing protein n=1 Tax=Janthinobacterium sp. SUN137 TaxID=3014789 RepID=UPI0027137C99|nr:FRG domain-containing protein [Janthinobacterium sp. SUN137]MDO8039570.1 FRG domain-containing protein [Janthinobacterium sp. SUN137]